MSKPELPIFQVWVQKDKAHFISVYEPVSFPSDNNRPGQSGLSFEASCVTDEMLSETEGLSGVARKQLRVYNSDAEGPFYYRANTRSKIQVKPTRGEDAGRQALELLMWERKALEALNIRPDFLFYGRNLILDLQCYYYDCSNAKGWALALRGITLDMEDQCPALRGYY